jgi:hypothetical protein
LIPLAKASFSVILRSLSVSLSYGTLEGKLEGMKWNGCCQEVRHDEEKNKTEDWRKQRREYGGSIRERNGKIYARIQYFSEDGKRHDKEREAPLA